MLKSMTRRTPVSRFSKSSFWPMQTAVNQLFEDFYSSFENPIPLTTKPVEHVTLAPAVDIIDTEDNIKIEAELPGMDVDDIKVSIDQGVLTITGEKNTSQQDKDSNYLMREVSYGYYQRHIPLPDSVDQDAAHCSFKKGMLWVELPKKAEATSTRRELKIEPVKQQSSSAQSDKTD